MLGITSLELKNYKALFSIQMKEIYLNLNDILLVIWSEMMNGLILYVSKTRVKEMLNSYGLNFLKMNY